MSWPDEFDMASEPSTPVRVEVMMDGLGIGLNPKHSFSAALNGASPRYTPSPRRADSPPRHSATFSASPKAGTASSLSPRLGSADHLQDGCCTALLAGERQEQNLLQRPSVQRLPSLHSVHNEAGQPPLSWPANDQSLQEAADRNSDEYARIGSLFATAAGEPEAATEAPDEDDTGVADVARRRRPEHSGWRPRRSVRICPSTRGLTEDVWLAVRSSEGRVNNPGLLLRTVACGGVSRSLRPEVWPLLLGARGWDDDWGAQAAAAAAARMEFASLVELSMHEQAAQEHYAAQGGLDSWVVTSRCIETDAPRCGREGALFVASAAAHTIARLARLLRAYALADPATGYCQGMGDIALPFLHLCTEDHEAFWLFKAMMAHIRTNFHGDMACVRRQMRDMREALAQLDAPLSRHLAALGVGEFEVAFQMLLLRFRRELGLEDTVMFWECLAAWEALARTPLLPYCAAALFRRHRRRLLKFTSLEEVIKFVNCVPAPIDVLELCAAAHAAWQACSAEPDLRVCGCVGMRRTRLRSTPGDPQ